MTADVSNSLSDLKYKSRGRSPSLAELWQGFLASFSKSTKRTDMSPHSDVDGVFAQGFHTDEEDDFYKRYNERKIVTMTKAHVPVEVTQALSKLSSSISNSIRPGEPKFESENLLNEYGINGEVDEDGYEQDVSDWNFKLTPGGIYTCIPNVVDQADLPDIPVDRYDENESDGDGDYKENEDALTYYTTTKYVKGKINYKNDNIGKSNKHKIFNYNSNHMNGERVLDIDQQESDDQHQESDYGNEQERNATYNYVHDQVDRHISQSSSFKQQQQQRHKEEEEEEEVKCQNTFKNNRSNDDDHDAMDLGSWSN